MNIGIIGAGAIGRYVCQKVLERGHNITVVSRQKPCSSDDLPALATRVYDVSELPAKPHAVALQNVLAEDINRPGIERDKALGNSADTKAGLFIVPTIIEE